MSKRPPAPLCDDVAIAAARLNAITYPEQPRIHELARRAQRAQRASTEAASSPPRLTGGESQKVTLVSRDGKVLEVPARSGYGGQAAFIDWINYTVNESSFYWDDKHVVPVTDDQMLACASVAIEGIFGYGLTVRREKGANFYKHSWELGSGFGLFCYGGQRDTCLISISGEGLAAAKPGWEKRLYEFLTIRADRPRITRCDLAYDDYSGASYSVDKADKDYDDNLFNCGGRNPDIEHRGNWKTPNGKGRTVYIGNRKNGKYARVYEKGKQLGCEDSEWCRVEVEFKGVDRDIPFDVLIIPGEYLSAAYPAFAWISQAQCRIETKKKEAVFSYRKLIDWLRHQAGPALHFACEIEGSAQALIELVSRPDKHGKYPKVVKHVLDWTNCDKPVFSIAAIAA